MYSDGTFSPFHFPHSSTSPLLPISCIVCLSPSLPPPTSLSHPSSPPSYSFLHHIAPLPPSLSFLPHTVSPSLSLIYCVICLSPSPSSPSTPLALFLPSHPFSLFIVCLVSSSLHSILTIISPSRAFCYHLLSPRSSYIIPHSLSHQFVSSTSCPLSFSYTHTPARKPAPLSFIFITYGTYPLSCPLNSSLFLTWALTSHPLVLS